MNNAIYNFTKPENEKILEYLPGSSERVKLEKELKNVSSEQPDIPIIIAGKEFRTGNIGKVTMPHDFNHVLATYHIASEKEIKMAINAALEAKEQWSNLSWIERTSIFMKIAELIAQKYRSRFSAITMLGQSKNCYQSEIDAICETVDFLRFNSFFISNIYDEQPAIEKNVINRLEYRPLEGFVFAISPFNFTAIAANLNTSVAVMGNTTVWKPATTALLSGYELMKIYKEAGLPDGVINFVPGSGSVIANIALQNKNLAGIHFTGSTDTFYSLWNKVNENIRNYKSFPRLVGETGGKDFIFVHNSANTEEVATAIVRGAYEYQGQKCSAASRAYIPESIWLKIKSLVIDMINDIKVGDVRDFDNFVNAVIDQKSYNNIMKYIDLTKKSNDAKILAGGTGDNSVGWFINPTLIETTNPHFITMEEEIFGPVMTVYVYPDNKFDETLELCDQTSPYALTGSIFGTDRYEMMKACRKLRYAAGNFYFNDKPTGAMVGQQPFGGARVSGTNDKAGSYLNLLRWVNPRTIKETLLPATNYKYSYMK